MPNKVLLDTQDGTPPQICFADHAGDFGPTAARNLEVGTPTDCQISMASVANAAARQSAKVDLGAVRAPRYKVRATIEFAATPTAGNVVEFYWAPSGSATAANANAGGVSGSNAAYTGDSSNLTAAVKQLERIGTFVCTEVPTAEGIQTAECGYFVPGERYGSLVVVNNSGAAIHSDDAEFHVVFDPVFEEIQ